MSDGVANKGHAFEWFIVWRYLLGRGRYVSPPLLVLCAVAIMCFSIALIVPWVLEEWSFFLFDYPDLARSLLQYSQVAKVAAPCALVVAVVVAALRYYFSFFTTVSIVGVMIGTMVLIVVLSVQNGFEKYLRSRILGVSAHIRVEHVDGNFAGYQRVEKELRGHGEVTATTPYLESEVVCNFPNQPTSVIIRGIDPLSVSKVTGLQKSIVTGSLGALFPLTKDVTAPLSTAEPEDFSGQSESQPEDVGGVDASANKRSTTGIANRQQAVLPHVPNPKSSIVTAAAAATATDTMPETATATSPSGLVKDPGTGQYIDGDIAMLSGVLIGSELHRQHDLWLGSGSEITLVSPLTDPTPAGGGIPKPLIRNYRVAGTFYTGIYEFDIKRVYVEMVSLQQFLFLDDVATGIEVRIKDINKASEIAEELQVRLGEDFRVQDWKRLNRGLFSALKLEKLAMFVLLGLIILVASFSIVGNLIMVVVDKGREIAILKAMGGTEISMVTIFCGQGLCIGSIGSIIGVVLGCLAARFGVTSIPLDPDVHYIDRLPVDLHWQFVLVVGVAGIVISTIATLYPARLAAKLAPLETLTVQR